jgi:hypothetical protein
LEGELEHASFKGTALADPGDATPAEVALRIEKAVTADDSSGRVERLSMGLEFLTVVRLHVYQLPPG